ncbi:MAG TPA: imidazole glycerol phosphate synthase subunit HisF [Gemmatimonadaceae bacterium]|nr:imidazole glycerol phosphate synthase subunit HisF [Gemmatimonadaceae bacterium]
MLTRRLIVCLDVKGGRVVKGVNFVGLRDVGDPVALATRYEAEGADEITFLDISASAEDRATLLDVARRTAERLFIPLTIGGGVRTADDVGRALRAGADKVSLNSAMVADPTVLTACADRFGAQCVVASIDAKLDDEGTWRVWTHGGRTRTELEAVAWAQECVERGAGEVLLTSIDRDGARTGYDLPLMHAVSSRVAAPVIASGGAGEASHIVDVLASGHADAALVAGILHDNVTTVGALKDAMRASGLVVR